MREWLHRLRYRIGSIPMVGGLLRRADDRRFERAIRVAFSFLTDQYGFTLQERRIPYERYVSFEKDGVKVVVQQELGTPPWVELVAPVVAVPGCGRRFGLHELEQEMKRASRYQPTLSAPDTLEEHVRELAEILRRIGDEVLRGDFSILFDRQRRHVNAVHNRR